LSGGVFAIIALGSLLGGIVVLLLVKYRKQPALDIIPMTSVIINSDIDDTQSVSEDIELTWTRVRHSTLPSLVIGNQATDSSSERSSSLSYITAPATHSDVAGNNGTLIPQTQSSVRDSSAHREHPSLVDNPSVHSTVSSAHSEHPYLVDDPLVNFTQSCEYLQSESPPEALFDSESESESETTPPVFVSRIPKPPVRLKPLTPNKNSLPAPSQRRHSHIPLPSIQAQSMRYHPETSHNEPGEENTVDGARQSTPNKPESTRRHSTPVGPTTDISSGAAFYQEIRARIQNQAAERQRRCSELVDLEAVHQTIQVLPRPTGNSPGHSLPPITRPSVREQLHALQVRRMSVRSTPGAPLTHPEEALQRRRPTIVRPALVTQTETDSEDEQ